MKDVENQPQRKIFIEGHGLAGSSEILHKAVEKAVWLRTNDEPAYIEAADGTEVYEIEKLIRGDRVGLHVEFDCRVFSADRLKNELLVNYNCTRKPLIEHEVGGTIFLSHIEGLDGKGQSFLAAFFDMVKRDKIDIKLIFSAHCDLKARTKTGDFSESLFQKICMQKISIPALSERPEDIEPFIEKIRTQENWRDRKIPRFHPDTVALIKKGLWDFNHVELEGAVVKLVLDNSGIEKILPDHIFSNRGFDKNFPTFKRSRAKYRSRGSSHPMLYLLSR